MRLEAKLDEQVDGGRAPGLGDLQRLLDREREILEGLRETLIRQRAGVAANDLEAVESATDAVKETMAVLDASRGERRRVLAGLAGRDDLPLSELESGLGRKLPPALSRARKDLVGTAREVSHELAVNRAVLSSAVRTGESFLRGVVSGLEQRPPRYGHGSPEPPREAPLLVNRMV